MAILRDLLQRFRPPPGPDFPTPPTRLRQLRLIRGYSLARLAEATGISLRQLRHYELGRTQPQWVRAQRVAKALGITVEELYGLIDEARAGR